MSLPGGRVAEFLNGQRDGVQGLARSRDPACHVCLCGDLCAVRLGPNDPGGQQSSQAPRKPAQAGNPSIRAVRSCPPATSVGGTANVRWRTICAVQLARGNSRWRRCRWDWPFQGTRRGARQYGAAPAGLPARQRGGARCRHRSHTDQRVRREPRGLAFGSALGDTGYAGVLRRLVNQQPLATTGRLEPERERPPTPFADDVSGFQTDLFRLSKSASLAIPANSDPSGFNESAPPGSPNRNLGPWVQRTSDCLTCTL